jgi:hypothetical protein
MSPWTNVVAPFRLNPFVLNHLENEIEETKTLSAPSKILRWGFGGTGFGECGVRSFRQLDITSSSQAPTPSSKLKACLPARSMHIERAQRISIQVLYST